MNTPPFLGATALLVHAHPEPLSFSTSQAHVATAALRELGYKVDVIDLYERDWAPVLDRGEFPAFDGPFKPQREQWDALRDGTLAPEVAADLTSVLNADLLVLSFPLWWFSVPAILKGWLDRVFVMGGVSGGDLGAFENGALTGKRAVLLATTGGSADAFAEDGAFGAADDFLFHINRGVLEFVGYDALDPIITYGPAHLDYPDRAEALDQVRAAFLNLRERELASTSRAHLRVGAR